MKKLISHNRDRLEQEAVDWLVKLTSGDADPDDFAEFAQWRQRSPAHKQAYQKIAGLWDSLDKPLLVWQQGQAEAEDRVAGQQKITFEDVAPQKNFLRASFRAFAIAAGFAILATINLFPDYWRHPWADYRTLIGDRAAITLADGSLMHLNTDTAINTRFTPNAREIELLQGEAEFEVAHDSRRPFIVTSGQIKTQAIGTKFLVRFQGNGGLISLLEGKTRSYSQTGSSKTESEVILTAGQQAPFNNNRIGTLNAIEIAAADAWKHGLLLMNFVTLGQAIQEINRYRRGTVKLLDGRLATREINAAIDLNHINTWLDALETSLPVRVRHLGPVILISSR